MHTVKGLEILCSVMYLVSMLQLLGEDVVKKMTTSSAIVNMITS